MKADAQRANEVNGALPSGIEAALKAARTTAGPRWLPAQIGRYEISIVKTHGAGWEIRARGLPGFAANSFIVSNDNTRRFVFDPSTPVVFYPEHEGWYSRICSLDLASMQRSTIYVPAVIDLGLLAVQKHANEFELAYATDRPCLPPDGIDSTLLPNNTRARQAGGPLRVCFVKMPAALKPSK